MNTLKATREEVISKVVQHLETLETGDHFTVSAHRSVEDAVVIRGRPTTQEEPLEVRPDTVLVGEMCGLAVLRGADVFSPGIVGLAPSIRPGARVSVMADIENKCLRGAKQFQGETRHVGNGVIQVSREELFKSESPQGLGVEMRERRHPCPSLDESLFSGILMLQNLPSIITVDMLGGYLGISLILTIFLFSDPQPGERVLDMCAAPGGKTTHIAQKMNNTGLVVAGDKSNNKIKTIQSNCTRLGVTNVRAFAMDSTKCLAAAGAEIPVSSDESVSPPFPGEYFDRILLDAPCSALGQRPQFYNKIKIKELESFPKIQRKLFSTAVGLLAPGGVLVYSTCTNNLEENDNMVTWAINTFPDIEEDAERKSFGRPNSEVDTITFFISRFRKKI